MLKSLAVLLFLLCSLPALANQSYSGVCNDVRSTGSTTTLRFLATFPQCTVTVYEAGTLSLATIYSDSLNTPLANPFTATTAGAWQFYAAFSHVDVVLSGAGFATPYTISDVILSDVAAPLPNIKRVDGVTFPTIASAIAACGGAPCIVDSTAHSETLASTINLAGMAVQVLLGPYTYTGPASGAAFVVGSYLANGSSIVGSGMTGPGQGDNGNGTTIKAANGNTMPLVQLLSGGGHFVNGIEVRDLNLDGNNVATSCLELDSVRFSTFRRLSMQNCTAYGLHTFSSTATADYGTQWNVFDQIYLYNVEQCAYLDGNSAATSDTTQNHFENWQCNFNSTTLPGLQLHQADGNQFSNIKLFATNGTGVSQSSNCLQFDSPVPGLVVGGLTNRFFGLHTSCLTGGHSIRAEPSTVGNEILAYDQIEGQPGPYDTGSISWNGTSNVPNIIRQFASNEVLTWSDGLYDGAPDVAIRRCAPGQLRISAGGINCEANGNLVGNFAQFGFYDTPATPGTGYSVNGVAVIDSNRVGIFTALSGVTYNAAGTVQNSVHWLKDVAQVGGGGTVTVNLVGAAAFTSNASYNCNTTDVSDGTKTSTYTPVSGSQITFIGTATDFIRFICMGN